VKKNCQTCRLNRKDAKAHIRSRKLIKDGIDDHERCEWVNVSSGTGSLRLSWIKSHKMHVVTSGEARFPKQCAFFQIYF